eukprot:CAMPEP_0119124082 /NCGR_PEP_ID=MMETSP1310-20130426/3805_1 /TAXON_ID=464262 /ORGANISM="Genus nov. species nov., Strain RCC2339" /LENGTH=636 /DNA_ID=CAMNT_0007113973 /DNA_START=114 /DNA_END=2021 /DNA_ORIENTATION=-
MEQNGGGSEELEVEMGEKEAERERVLAKVNNENSFRSIEVELPSVMERLSNKKAGPCVVDVDAILAKRPKKRKAVPARGGGDSQQGEGPVLSRMTDVIDRIEKLATGEASVTGYDSEDSFIDDAAIPQRTVEHSTRYGDYFVLSGNATIPPPRRGVKRTSLGTVRSIDFGHGTVVRPGEKRKAPPKGPAKSAKRKKAAPPKVIPKVKPKMGQTEKAVAARKQATGATTTSPKLEKNRKILVKKGSSRKYIDDPDLVRALTRLKRSTNYFLKKNPPPGRFPKKLVPVLQEVARITCSVGNATGETNTEKLVLSHVQSFMPFSKKTIMTRFRRYCVDYENGGDESKDSGDDRGKGGGRGNSPSGGTVDITEKKMSTPTVRKASKAKQATGSDTKGACGDLALTPSPPKSLYNGNNFPTSGEEKRGKRPSLKTKLESAMEKFRLTVAEKCSRVSGELEALEAVRKAELAGEGTVNEDSRQFGSIPPEIRRACFGRDVKERLLHIYDLQSAIVDKVNSTREKFNAKQDDPSLHKKLLSHRQERARLNRQLVKYWPAELGITTRTLNRARTSLQGIGNSQQSADPAKPGAAPGTTGTGTGEDVRSASPLKPDHGSEMVSQNGQPLSLAVEGPSPPNDRDSD